MNAVLRRDSVGDDALERATENRSDGDGAVAGRVGFSLAVLEDGDDGGDFPGIRNPALTKNLSELRGEKQAPFARKKFEHFSVVSFMIDGASILVGLDRSVDFIKTNGLDAATSLTRTILFIVGRIAVCRL